MIVQRAGAAIDSMLMDGSVRVHVCDDVLLGMPMGGISMTVVVVAVGASCGLRDKAALQGKSHRCRHHQDVDEPQEPGACAKAQHVTSRYRFNLATR
ncbi:MAG TPA: hypothetical protein VLJ17_14535 [Xanthobacteraceae bacterium]|nr:hypothetical protein [Xanthobacteraceae bacterium]